jgi:hypothetical protein
MSDLMRVMHNQWVRPDDIKRAVPFREDSAEVIDGCIEVLRQRSTASAPASGETREMRAQGKLVAAKVGAAIKRPADRDVREQLALHQHAIDRLLAYVPTRMPAVDADRLHALSGQLLEHARAIIDNAVVSALIADEADPDTEACHRITVRLAVPKGPDVGALIFGIHKKFAEIASIDESLSIRLIVDVEVNESS